jgi:transcriptional regulator with XRE-family HTH domain
MRRILLQVRTVVNTLVRTYLDKMIAMTENETLTERFCRLTEGMSDTKIAAIMNMTERAVRKLRLGDTQSYDLHRALRLAEYLGVSPWYLAVVPEPQGPRSTTPAVAGGSEESVLVSLSRIRALDEKLETVLARLHELEKERAAAKLPARHRRVAQSS